MGAPTSPSPSSHHHHSKPEIVYSILVIKDPVNLTAPSPHWKSLTYKQSLLIRIPSFIPAASCLRTCLVILQAPLKHTQLDPIFPKFVQDRVNIM